MKRNKIIALSLVSASLLGATVPALFNSHTQTIEASKIKHDYFWWEKPRTVRVTKKHKIYEIQGVIPRYKSYVVKTKTLKKGQIVKIHHAASFLWIVQGKGLANGYASGNDYSRFWVANGMKGWYSLNLN